MSGTLVLLIAATVIGQVLSFTVAFRVHASRRGSLKRPQTSLALPVCIAWVSLAGAMLLDKSGLLHGLGAFLVGAGLSTVFISLGWIWEPVAPPVIRRRLAPIGGGGEP